MVRGGCYLCESYHLLSLSLSLSHCDVTFFQSAPFTVSQMLLHFAVEAEGNSLHFHAYKKLIALCNQVKARKLFHVDIMLLYSNYCDTAVLYVPTIHLYCSYGFGLK